MKHVVCCSCNLPLIQNLVSLNLMALCELRALIGREICRACASASSSKLLLQTPMFSSLQHFEISFCSEMKSLFMPELLPNFKNLVKLKVEGCENMVEIIGQSSDEDEDEDDNKEIQEANRPSYPSRPEGVVFFGMKPGWDLKIGLDWRLISWTNPDDLLRETTSGVTVIISNLSFKNSCKPNQWLYQASLCLESRDSKLGSICINAMSGGGGGCAMWFGDLIDIRAFQDGGQDLYVRMHASELGTNGKREVKIVVEVLAVIFVVCGMFLLAHYIYKVGARKGLEGMKLGWDFRTGLERRFVSWKSPDDPSPGDFAWGITLHNYPKSETWKGYNQVLSGWTMEWN
ncbi:hypothetical protein FEM48_Zijuj07G0166900 [Ziziphus jujuba var. spinosa]|uniref:Disease resistance protein At4g27190-like leucine-rich repeats domain-containing protein n=1 Tax=Ziziphus jujuba var. spinosa TaxID=714518 RepID=A0A978V5S2_ZIZJJ|nr:hypothetical protein FEM48_Zijuj07G0166900 [Ziziphus jujuba var. spinosa]